MGYLATWRRVQRIMEHLNLRDMNGDGKCVYHPRGVLGMPDTAAEELRVLKRRVDALMNHLGLMEYHQPAKDVLLKKGGPEPGE